MLKARPQWSITIEGHTDSTATAEHNQDLSERRAQAVRQYLESAGIVTARLSTAGYGATRPVSSNDTPLGRAQNRRVELVKQ
jgi:outer membrane protein OmpA-like peptidoglycan-associated protein